MQLLCWDCVPGAARWIASFVENNRVPVRLGGTSVSMAGFSGGGLLIIFSTFKQNVSPRPVWLPAGPLSILHLF